VAGTYVVKIMAVSGWWKKRSESVPKVKRVIKKKQI
jgi:hypothetical protein